MRQQFNRFYKDVALAEDPSGTGWRLLLDGKPVKTPLGRTLSVAHKPLAEAIASEWRTQGETVELASMPMTRLSTSLIDHVVPRAAAVREAALGYGKTDLLCYRTAEPERLAQRQDATWQPYLDWAAEALGARLKVATGLTAIAQDGAALAALEERVGALDAYRLLALHALTTRLGSLVLAFAVLHGRIGGREAAVASRLDELFQTEIWGRDEAAELSAALFAREVEDLERFLSLLA